MGLREENIEKRRRKILSAARKVVASKGPGELSMRALAGRAGFSVTTLYNLFGSKDEILLALIQEGVASVQPIIDAQSESDPLAALERLTVIPAAFLARNAGLFQPMIAAGLYQNGGRTPQMQTFYGTLVVAIENLVKAAQDAGHLNKDVSARLLAAEIFYSFRVAVEDWGCGLIGNDALFRRIQVGVRVILLAAATGKAREQILNKVKNIEEPAIGDMGALFPGLGKLPSDRPAATRGKGEIQRDF